MTLIRDIVAHAGLNPYRTRRLSVRSLIGLTRYAVASAQMLAVLSVPGYAGFIRRNMPRPVDMMVIGAQKSGTTWVHAQFQTNRLAVVSDIKECHHFDRGRLGSLRHYLRQFGDLADDRPIIEVAPDYGPLSKWRIKAIQRLFPELRLAFIARNPVTRAWSGTRMETSFDRGMPVDAVPQRDLLDHLGLPRSLRYADYAKCLQGWVDIFGSDRLRIFPFEMIEGAPSELIADLVAHASRKTTHQQQPQQTGGAVFNGNAANMHDAIRQKLRRDYLPYVPSFTAFAARIDARFDWSQIAQEWASDALAPQDQPEQNRHALVVCGFCPNPDANSSGQKLAFRRIEEIAARFARVDVVYFVNRLDRLDHKNAGPHWPENIGTVTAINLTWRHRMAGVMAHPRLPVFAASRRCAGRKVIERHLSNPRYSDFFADFSQGLAAIPSRSFGLFNFRQHDIVSRLYDRKAQHATGLRRAINRIESARSRRWETKAWAGALRIETLSVDDAAFIQQTCPAAEINAQAAQGTITVPAHLRTCATIIPGRLIFWGNLSRAENIDAAVRMARDLLPEIRKTIPVAHLWIVGAHPAKDVIALEGDAVHVTGFVDNPVNAFCAAAAAVVPLRFGSGVKIKVIETLDAGIPTITSEVGSEGIAENKLLISTRTDEQFIAETCKVLLRTLPM